MCIRDSLVVGPHRMISKTAWSLVVPSCRTLQASSDGQSWQLNKVTSMYDEPLEEENVGKLASLTMHQVDADTKSSRRRPEASLRAAPQAGDLAFASIPTMKGVFPSSSWMT